MIHPNPTHFSTSVKPWYIYGTIEPIKSWLGGWSKAAILNARGWFK